MAVVDLLISFDTTGSMSAVIGSVRNHVHATVREMKAIDPAIRIGIIAHGDYCDRNTTYTIRSLDLTDDEERLHQFIKGTGDTYGGDADECYELALQTARKDFSWRAEAEKMLILIGDCNPHKVGYTCSECPGFVNDIDWKDEARLLHEMNVKIYAVHALPQYRSGSRTFYKHIADVTDGVYLQLDQFREVIDLIMASCYSQYDEVVLNEFVTMIKEKGRLSRSMASNLNRLTGKQYDVQTLKSFEEKGLVPVPPGRFQVLEVEEDIPIKAFVLAHGVEFEKGRGFYELSKPETVQQYKEVILEDKASGDLYTGTEVRNYLGLQPQIEGTRGGDHEHIKPAVAREYIVYIQSTSVNRKLIHGTRFLYEVKDIGDSSTE
ncbi:hypothetical protein FACS1894172_19230 [Spirochaetia bacterium]|nr:hypothetical protein FACS1894172_19230 [Spirochaetia bacterium]